MESENACLGTEPFVWLAADGGAGPKWIRFKPRRGTVGRPGSGGVSLPSQVNRNESLTDSVGLRRLAGWVRRSCDAMLADLEFVDCGSLDVLLYCADDLAVTGRGDFEIDRSRR